MRSRSPMQSGNRLIIEWKVRMCVFRFPFWEICPPSLNAMIKIFTIRVPTLICKRVSSWATSELISRPFISWFKMDLRYKNLERRAMLLNDFLFTDSELWSLSFEYIFLSILSLTSGMGSWRYVVNTLSSYSIWGSRLDSEAKTPYMMQSTKRSKSFHLIVTYARRGSPV